MKRDVILNAIESGSSDSKIIVESHVMVGNAATDIILVLKKVPSRGLIAISHGDFKRDLMKLSVSLLRKSTVILEYSESPKIFITLSPDVPQHSLDKFVRSTLELLEAKK